jgi:hypothetical protein
MAGSYPNVPITLPPREGAQAINHLLNRKLYPFEPLTAAPSNPSEGCTYYDLTLHKARTWNGSAWNALW